jgi:DNA-binding GntR family transcriptional regulator
MSGARRLPPVGAALLWKVQFAFPFHRLAIMTTAENDVAAKSSEAIAKDIAAAIAERRVPPGAKLREEALSRLYGVSRTKIRAALLMLSKEKLINIIPDKGAFVSEPTEAEAREIFSVRRTLEAAMVREFVAKAKAADFRKLEKHLAAERAALTSGDPQNRSRLLGDFHLALAGIAGNKVLADILAELIARSSLITMLYQSDRDAICSADEHKEFIRVAKKGDAEQAVQLMLDHLHHVEAALQFEKPVAAEKPDLLKALLA